MNPLLLTPGPLTTAAPTREAMSVDWGSRDGKFIAITANVRQSLVALCADERYTCVPLQGSGTFAVEAMIGTLVPRDGKVLVLVNGAYGERILSICRYSGRAAVALQYPETEPVVAADVDSALTADPAITHVAMIWCETTSGVLNPVEAVGAVVARHGRRFLIDGMSAFGALPISAATTPFTALAASSNKCLEGVPGMGFVIVDKATLAAAAGNAHALSLDLHAQEAGFLANGQWRFTPPTHVVAALDAAITLHAAEGGVAGRGARYRENCRLLVEGMRARGFQTLLRDDVQAPIIVTFRQPDGFSFADFYEGLRARGFAIYPGKLTRDPTFRVGCIGQVFPADIERFFVAVDDILGVRT